MTYDIYLRNSTIQITSVGLTRIWSNDCCFLTAVVVVFERRTYTVGEEDGQVELCVNITVPRRQDIGAVTFNLAVETQNGSAGISYSRNWNATYLFYLDRLWRDVYKNTNHVSEYPYVMYNLPHSYMHFVHYTNVHGTFRSQWPRGCFSVLVTNHDFRSNRKCSNSKQLPALPFPFLASIIEHV